MIRPRRCLLAILLAVAAGPGQAAEPAKVGEPAPDFTVRTLDGRKVSLGELRGKVVVINYWATWCAPCKKEMPLLSTFHERFSPIGLEVYSITVDRDAPRKRLRKIDEALSYPLAVSLQGKGYGVLTGVPTNYIIDRSGRLRFAKAGSLDLDSLNGLLIPLLREPAPND